MTIEALDLEVLRENYIKPALEVWEALYLGRLRSNWFDEAREILGPHEGGIAIIAERDWEENG